MSIECYRMTSQRVWRAIDSRQWRHFDNFAVYPLGVARFQLTRHQIVTQRQIATWSAAS